MSAWNLYDLISVARDFAETAPDAPRSTIGQSGARYYAARDADSEQLTRAAGLAHNEPAVQAVLRRWATEAVEEVV